MEMEIDKCAQFFKLKKMSRFKIHLEQHSLATFQLRAQNQKENLFPLN